MKEENNNNPFQWFGSSGVNKKAYWLVLSVLALVEIIFGISIFFSSVH